MITNFNTPVEELDGHIYVSVDELHKRDKEIEKLNKIIEELKAILKSKGYETYIPVLEGSDKE